MLYRLFFVIVIIVSISTELLSVKDEAEKLQLIEEVKDYAKNKFGLEIPEYFYNSWGKRNNEMLNYIYVSLPDTICLPKEFSDYYYYGTNKRKALRAEERFKRKGFHVLLYQTAGNAIAVLNERLISYPDDIIVKTILHEAVHVHLRTKGKNVPYEYEEAFCDIIANYGAIEFAKKIRKIDVNTAKKNTLTEEAIYTIINQAIRELGITKEPKQKQNIYNTCEKRLNEIIDTSNIFFRDRFQYPVNNAYFVRVRNYSYNYFDIKYQYEKFGSIDKLVNYLNHFDSKSIMFLRLKSLEIETP